MIYSYRTYMHFTYVIDITYDSLFIPLSAICLIYTVRLSVTHVLGCTIVITILKRF